MSLDVQLLMAKTENFILKCITTIKKPWKFWSIVSSEATQNKY